MANGEEAETEEDLEKIRAMEVSEMEQAINEYHAITASPGGWELKRLREKVRYDEAQVLYYEEQKGRQEGISEWNIEIAQKLLK